MNDSVVEVRRSWVFGMACKEGTRVQGTVSCHVKRERTCTVHGESRLLLHLHSIRQYGVFLFVNFIRQSFKTLVFYFSFFRQLFNCVLISPPPPNFILFIFFLLLDFCFFVF